MLISDQGITEANINSPMKQYLDSLSKVSEARRVKVFLKNEELKGRYYLVLQPIIANGQMEYFMVFKRKSSSETQDAIRIKLQLVQSILMS
jgi:hypothetical protein